MRNPLFVIGWALLCAGPVFGQSFRTDSGTIAFTSSVPLHTFTGTSERLTGRINLADSTVDFFVDLETLQTGIGKRDRDMRLTLETDAFPYAEFFGKLNGAIPEAEGVAHPVDVAGQFSVHGVSREVVVSGTVTRTSAGLLVNAAWELNLSDYDIEPPSLLIVKVDEIQRIQLDALLKPESK